MKSTNSLFFWGGMRSKLDFFWIWYFSNDPKRLFLVHSGSPCQTGKILWKQLILNYYHSALPKMSGKLNLPYKAYAFLEIVQSAPITMGFNFTLVALWILLFSRARSWYLSSVSSSVASILWCASLAFSISVHPCQCVFAYYGNIWSIVLQPLVRKGSRISSYPHFSILCEWRGLMVVCLIGTL